MPMYERTWYRITSCMLVMLAGIGLVRYAYSPLIPSMLDHHWITAAEAGYIGTFNFIGNMIGAVFCALLARRFTAGWVCRMAMLIGLISVAASAFDFGFVWLASCRFLAGLTAAGAMILAPVIAVSGVSQSNRSTYIGYVFIGAGAGVIGLSLMLPLFLSDGPAGGWWFTAVLVLVCTVLSWAGTSPRIPTDRPLADDSDTVAPARTMWIFFLSYVLVAIGIVPHSIYLSAYVHQVLDQPVAFSTMVYAIYGGGVLVGGPFFGGVLARLISTHFAQVMTGVTCLLAVVIVLSTTSLWFVVASGAILGAAQMGVATCATHRTMELVGPANHTKWWGRITIGFNIGQAVGAFGMGLMIHIGWGYLAGFWMAAICLLLSTILTFFVRLPHTPTATPGTS